jgi:hypothetical protein
VNRPVSEAQIAYLRDLTTNLSVPMPKPRNFAEASREIDRLKLERDAAGGRR